MIKASFASKLFLLTFAASVPTAAFAETSRVTLVKAKRVYLGDGAVLQPGQVLVRDGKIVEVGVEIAVGDQDAKIVEADSLLPGLIDANTQAGIVAGQAVEFTSEVTPHLQVAESIDWGSRAFIEHLSEGVTCIHATPDTDNVFGGLTAMVKTAGGSPEARTLAVENGLSIAVCSDPARRNRSRTRPDSIYVRQPTNRMGVIWLLRANFHQARLLANSQAGEISSDRQVLMRALAGELPIFALSRTHYDMLGLLSVAKEFGFTPVVLGGQEAWRIIDQLAEAKASVVLSPQVPGAQTGPESTRLCAVSALRLQEAGVPFCFSGPALLDQARLAVRCGLSPEAALQAVTSSPAAILGVHDRIGTITAGKDADLVAVAGDLFEFTSPLQWVMVDGNLHFANESP